MFDLVLIGDKLKWYVYQLQFIYYCVYDSNFQLVEVLSVLLEWDFDFEFIDDSGSDSMDYDDLSFFYFFFGDFVSEMMKCDINGDIFNVDFLMYVVLGDVSEVEIDELQNQKEVEEFGLDSENFQENFLLCFSFSIIVSSSFSIIIYGVNFEFVDFMEMDDKVVVGVFKFFFFVFFSIGKLNVDRCQVEIGEGV